MLLRPASAGGCGGRLLEGDDRGQRRDHDVVPVAHDRVPVAVLLLWPLGFGKQVDSTARWWFERPLWIAVPGAILVGLVAIFGRFERPKTAS